MRLLILISILLFPFIGFSQFGTVSNSTQNANSKISSNTFAVNYPANHVGRLCVVAFAFDNTTSGTDGDNNEISSVSDGNGNIYTKAAEYANVQTGAGTGATISVWYCIPSINVGTGVFVTAYFTNSGIVAKAASLHAISTTVGVVAIEAVTQVANDNANPGSLTLSSLPSREYAFFRFSAVEIAGGSSTSATSGWGNLTAPIQGTTGGGGATNMSIYGERIISTTTSITSAPTTTNGDGASVLIAFYEYTPPTSQPRRVLKLKTHRP